MSRLRAVEAAEGRSWKHPAVLRQRFLRYRRMRCLVNPALRNIALSACFTDYAAHLRTVRCARRHSEVVRPTAMSPKTR